MQSQDEHGKPLDAAIFTNLPQLGGLEAMQKRLQAELNKQDVASVVVGKLPNKGDEIKINGLVFLVKFVDYKRGTLQLALAKYKEDTEDENGVTHEPG
jgi:hypothetical protein